MNTPISVRFWQKVDKNGPLPDQTNPHYTGLDQCWEWTGGKFSSGYGCFRIGGRKGKVHGAHRVCFMLSHDADLLETDKQVLHKCDNRSCVNPSHLMSGSHADNMRDKVKKGRSAKLYPGHPFRTTRSRGNEHYSRIKPELLARGEFHGSKTKPEKVSRGTSHGMSKFSDEQIIKMREEWESGKFTQKQLWEKYKTSKTHLKRIINRKLWRHIK